MNWLEKIFHHSELFTQRSIQALYVILFFDLVFTFNSWTSQGYLTVQSVKENDAICWPYFQNCLDLYVFQAIPQGYSLGILYMVIGGFLFTSLYFSYREKWDKALLFLAIPALFKFLMLYVFSYLPIGNYHVLGLVFVLLLLFAKHKLFALKVAVTVFYFCAAALKINAGYISGSIFSSLALGVPIFPNSLLPYYGLVFILIVVAVPFFLWSAELRVRIMAVSILAAFHVYSITLVGFRFAALCIPILFILFILSDYEKFSFKKIRTDVFSFILISLIILGQSLPIIIAGDERITSEGEKYGFYMYTANRQCIRTINVHYKDGTSAENTYEDRKGMRRCDPYEDWFRIQQACKQDTVSRIEWIFNVSINGSYFYTLVDVPNACVITEYKAFSHNDWLKTDIQDTSLPVLKNSI